MAHGGRPCLCSNGDPVSLAQNGKVVLVWTWPSPPSSALQLCCLLSSYLATGFYASSVLLSQFSVSASPTVLLFPHNTPVYHLQNITLLFQELNENLQKTSEVLLSYPFLADISNFSIVIILLVFPLKWTMRLSKEKLFPESSCLEASES